MPKYRIKISKSSLMWEEVYADEVYDLKDRLKALGIGDELITVRPWS